MQLKTDVELAKASYNQRCFKIYLDTKIILIRYLYVYVHDQKMVQ